MGHLGSVPLVLPGIWDRRCAIGRKQLSDFHAAPRTLASWRVTAKRHAVVRVILLVRSFDQLELLDQIFGLT